MTAARKELRQARAERDEWRMTALDYPALAIRCQQAEATVERQQRELAAWHKADDLAGKYLLGEWVDAVEVARRLRAENAALAAAPATKEEEDG